MGKKLKILILSSYSKDYSAGLGQGVIAMLQNAGHDVTWGYNGIEEQIEYIRNKREKHLRNLDKYRLYYKLIFAIKHFLFGKGKNTFFEISNEEKPDYVSKLMVEKIEGNYDLIYILFSSFMISAKIIKELHDKFNCPIIASGIDMYYMTGGCLFLNGCDNYKNECRNCPGHTYFRKGLSHKNYLYKKKVYEASEFTLICNTWMSRFVKNSRIFEGANILIKSYTLDEKLFCPHDRFVSRESLGINRFDGIIMMTRCDLNPRKGFNYTIEAIKLICKEQPALKDKLILLTVGEIVDNLDRILPVRVEQKGKVSTIDLIKCYSASDIFISSSTDDAGPSMVNQAMACGVPILSFEIGTAIDVVTHGVNGYIASLCNQKEFARCMLSFLQITKEERELMRLKAREAALKYNSLEAGAKAIESVYYKFRS